MHEGGILEDLKTSDRLAQSLVSMSSGVGSSGWLGLQQHQYTIGYTSVSECDNNRVDRGLVIIIIVKVTLSFLFIQYFVFRTYELVVNLYIVWVVVGTPFDK